MNKMASARHVAPCVESQQRQPQMDKSTPVSAQFRVNWEPGLLVRQGVEVSSPRVRTIKHGDLFSATGVFKNSHGVKRLFVGDGWVSETAGPKLDSPCASFVDMTHPDPLLDKNCRREALECVTLVHRSKVQYRPSLCFSPAA